MLLATSCVPRKKLIQARGLHFIHLGESMPPEGAERLKGFPLQDTTIEEGDYSWRAAVLQYRQGRVLLEEDFYGSDILSRIRVETPELRLKNGLRVGMTVEDLRKKSGAWFIAPLEKYRLFDFYTRSMPGLHFLVDDPARDMTDLDYSTYSPDQFAPGARIVAIVLL
jgi:hypothetical protein